MHYTCFPSLHRMFNWLDGFFWWLLGCRQVVLFSVQFIFFYYFEHLGDLHLLCFPLRVSSLCCQQLLLLLFIVCLIRPTTTAKTIKATTITHNSNINNNNNIRSRSCLATIANFYMAAQLKIVCAVLFFILFFYSHC